MNVVSRKLKASFRNRQDLPNQGEIHAYIYNLYTLLLTFSNAGYTPKDQRDITCSKYTSLTKGKPKLVYEGFKVA